VVAAERERAAQNAVAQERSRLARELHDIVSHNLSVVVPQAGAARAQGDTASSGALEKIERSSREALVEMRRLLGVLRGDDADEATALTPQPGIDQLRALRRAARPAAAPSTPQRARASQPSARRHHVASARPPRSLRAAPAAAGSVDSSNLLGIVDDMDLLSIHAYTDGRTVPPMPRYRIERHLAAGGVNRRRQGGRF
jgi:hypothetical protein